MAAVAAVVALTLACRLPMQRPPPAATEAVASPLATWTRPPEATAVPASATEAPTDTPTATITPTATLGPPIFTTTTNANCRAGPGLMYDVVRVVMAGTTEPIVGRDAASTWWVVQGGARCWISNVTGTASGDLSGVPVIPAPPTPTPTGTATPTVTATPTLHLLIPPRTIEILPRVSAANVTVDRASCMPCPCRATWSGTITATGPLTAEYRWEYKRDSGVWMDAAMFGSLMFSGPGTLNAYDVWLHVLGPAAQTVTYRLRVTSPNSVYSNEVAVRFCAP